MILRFVKYVVLPLGIIAYLGGQSLGTSAADTGATILGSGGGLGVHLVKKTATEFQDTAKADKANTDPAKP